MEMSAEIKAGLSGANCVSGEKVGTLKIYLNDGTWYSIQEAKLQVDGVLYGTMIANITGQIWIKDETNSLESVI